MKVWCDHCGQPKGALQAAAVEQPAEQLQGAKSPCGGTPQQPQREPDAVQQAPETCQHHQPREYSLYLVLCFFCCCCIKLPRKASPQKKGPVVAITWLGFLMWLSKTFAEFCLKLFFLVLS